MACDLAEQVSKQVWLTICFGVITKRIISKMRIISREQFSPSLQCLTLLNKKPLSLRRPSPTRAVVIFLMIQNMFIQSDSRTSNLTRSVPHKCSMFSRSFLLLLSAGVDL